MKKISIIIVTYNSEKDIYDCLQSIRQYSDIPAEDLEIIIVDNNSKATDKMFAEIKNQFGDDILLIKNDRNGGYGQGNNIGIRNATAPLVLIMNPDVRFMEPIFRTIIEKFDRDDKLYMYGLKQMFSQTIESHRSFSFTNMMNGYLWVLLTGLLNRFDIYWPRYQYLQGSCFVVKREAIESVGLFDENFFLYGEEDDLHYKLIRKYGVHIYYNKRLHYIHLVEQRPLNLDYEIKLLDIAIKRHEQKGYSREKTLRNFLRRTDLRMVREFTKMKLHKESEGYDIIMRFREYIRKELNSNTNK